MTTTFSELRRALALQLGYGDRTPEGWGDARTAILDRVVNRGYRLFLYPTVPGRPNKPHRWSFLTVSYRLPTVAGQSDYDLPADFGAAYDRVLSFEAPFTSGGVIITSPGVAKESSLKHYDSGVPVACSIRQRDYQPGQYPRYTLTLYPTPNAVYGLLFRYTANPLPLSDENPQPLGGPEHAETLIAAVLAAGELELEDGPKAMNAEWQKHLSRSIAFDNDNAPDTLCSSEVVHVERGGYVTYKGFPEV